MNIKTTHAIQDGNCSKTFTGSGTKRTWCEPLEEVSTGMPGRQASRTFNVPQNTLGGSPEDENAPVQYCVYCAHHGWTLWCSTVCVVHIMGERSGAVLCVLCTSWVNALVQYCVYCAHHGLFLWCGEEELGAQILTQQNCRWEYLTSSTSRGRSLEVPPPEFLVEVLVKLWS